MSSVGWQRRVSNTDLGTYRCQISFSTPSQSHSKSNKRMLEGGSWGSSVFVLTEKNSANTDTKSRWRLHGPAIRTQLPSWGRNTHFGSVLHNAAAASAGTPAQYDIITGIIFLFLCTHHVYPSVFPSRNCTLHVAEDSLKTKPVLIFMFSYCCQRYTLTHLLHLTHDMHQLIRSERESRNRILSKKKEKQLTW